jgi:hypothetical protein
MGIDAAQAERKIAHGSTRAVNVLIWRSNACWSVRQASTFGRKRRAASHIRCMSVLAKLSDKEGGNHFLHTNHAWPYTVLRD